MNVLRFLNEYVTVSGLQDCSFGLWGGVGLLPRELPPYLCFAADESSLDSLLLSHQNGPPAFPRFGPPTCSFLSCGLQAF
ncbi:hypothetical protein Scep_026621 [Stephania cephalantha]|uniref:Uncharacterized protein n=1 Tax=Stephania cephalantha TaxID=152367 RepID=A0AAP0ENN3_9MAGN